MEISAPFPQTEKWRVKKKDPFMYITHVYYCSYKVNLSVVETEINATDV